MLARIALFSFRKRWLVLAVWVALLAGITAWSQSLGSAFSMNFKLPGSDSQAALDLLQTRFPARSGATGDVVFKSAADVHDPAVRADVESVISRISQVQHVTAVVGPYSQEGASQLSPSGHIARVVIQFDDNNEQTQKQAATLTSIKNIVVGANSQSIQFELGGELFAGQPNIGATEIIGVVAAIIILLLAFGSVLAMGLPIVQGLSRAACVITAAAAIMITAFGSFAVGDQRVIKEFGFRLAVTVLIGASIVRLKITEGCFPAKRE